jgi:hypothetical protein
VEPFGRGNTRREIDLKKKIGKFSVLVILGMLVTMSLFGGEVAASEIEVIITQEGDRECALVTFEGIPDWTPVGDIPGTDINMPDGWFVLSEGNPCINVPSPVNVAFWMTGNSANILFNEPICAVSFYYGSVVDVTLVAYDEVGNLITSTTGSGNYDGGLIDEWDPIGVDVGENIITRAVIHGGTLLTYIDDLKVCRIVAPEIVIQNLIDDIENMDLNAGNVNSFLSKLDNILMLLENGNDNVAINLLEALINAVEAQRGNKLTNEEADALITAAQNIINYINENLT